MWQTYIYPANKNNLLHIDSVPTGYSGIWRCWDENGDLCHRMSCKNGKWFTYESFVVEGSEDFSFGASVGKPCRKYYYVGKDSYEIHWDYPDGWLEGISMLTNDSPHRFEVVYNKTGSIILVANYKDGEFCGFVNEHDEKGAN